MAIKVSPGRYVNALAGVVLASGMATASAQTAITLDRNKYSVAQDVELGREAAAEVRKQLPMLNDDTVDHYVERIGGRLVAAIPPNLRHREFRYAFDVVNQKEINAFALPGGPMFLNRGMIEAARSEGEVAGVMAHEVAHVALRHGTAQATKGEKFQIGALAGQILGAIVGGTTGSIIAQGSQFGLGAYFMKFSREYETQADLLGAQIMARAGYDPRSMADMFKTIEAQGGSSGPEWLSDHPNPGNRYAAINREAAMLRVASPPASGGDFPSVQARLRSMSPAYTAEQIARGQARTGRPAGTAARSVRVSPPSRQYRTHRNGRLQITVPNNWRQFGDSSAAISYAPDGAVFNTGGGGTAFTHGVEVGVVQGSGNLQRDTDRLLQSLAQSNPRLRRTTNYQPATVGSRQGLTAHASSVSEVSGGSEHITLATTQLRDGNVLYVIGVAPQPEAGAYQETFRRVQQSVEVAER
jgi:Zn-dependent protease with chaperone function